MFIKEPVQNEQKKKGRFKNENICVLLPRIGISADVKKYISDTIGEILYRVIEKRIKPEIIRTEMNRYILGAGDDSSTTKELFKKYLYNDLPDVDFLIRTSGENRVSNFMLWQISYAEMYFPKVYFPDFTPKCLEEAIEEYEKRDRRFGNIK